MKRTTAVLIVTASLAFGACGESGTSSEDASGELNVILDDMMEHTLEIDVSARIARGLPITELPHYLPGFGLPTPAAISYEAARGEIELQQETMTRLLALDRDALSEAEQLTLDAVLWETSMTVEGFEHL